MTYIQLPLIVSIICILPLINGQSSPKKKNGLGAVETNAFWSADAGATDCTSPNGVQGQCKPLRSCGPLYRQLRVNPTSQFFRFLRRSSCRLPNSRASAVCCTREAPSMAPTSSTTPSSGVNFLILGVSSTTTTTSTTTTPPSTTTSSTTTPSTTTPSTTTPSTTPPSTTTPSSTSAPETELPGTEIPAVVIDELTSEEETPVIAGIFEPEVTTTIDTLSELDMFPIQCGVPNLTTTTTRIVGGRVAQKGAWPWLAALGYSGRGKTNFLCGGALITERHILTAAHCVEGRNDLTTIRLGEHDIDLKDEAEHEDFGIESSVVHPDYDGTNFENDIAIVKLDRNVEYKENILPGCLPLNALQRSRDHVGRRAFVAGWGSIAYNNVSSPVLREAMVPIRTNEECQESYNIFKSIIINEQRLCAGVGGDDACQGDSGGPLMVYDFNDDKYYIIGVVSVGFRCAEAEFPGIYIRTASYIDWIAENTF